MNIDPTNARPVPAWKHLADALLQYANAAAENNPHCKGARDSLVKAYRALGLEVWAGVHPDMRGPEIRVDLDTEQGAE